MTFVPSSPRVSLCTHDLTLRSYLFYICSDSGGGDDQDGRRNLQAAAGQSWSRGFLRGPHDAEEEEGEEESKDDGSSSGGQQQQQQLRRRFFVGQWLDVKDTVNNWLEATVMDMTSCGELSVGLQQVHTFF